MAELLQMVEAILSGLVISVRLFVGGIASAVNAVSSLLGLGWSEGQVGVVTGILVGGVIGFVYFRVKIWWKGVTTPFKPQSLVHKTDKTPAEVSSRGCSLTLFGIAVLIAAIVLLWVLGSTSP